MQYGPTYCDRIGYKPNFPITECQPAFIALLDAMIAFDAGDRVNLSRALRRAVDAEQNYIERNTAWKLTNMGNMFPVRPERPNLSDFIMDRITDLLQGRNASSAA